MYEEVLGLRYFSEVALHGGSDYRAGHCLSTACLLNATSSLTHLINVHVYLVVHCIV